MRIARWILLVGGAACMLAAPATALASESSAASVVGLRLSGVVDPFEANYIEGGIEAAQSDHADAVLLTIDTPGGLDSSMRQIIQAIANASVPVVCYTSPQGARAASAGTFIMMSCPVAAMAPGTAIGAAHPVGVSGVIEQDKVTNDAVALIRSLAEEHGRNADWAERAVRESVSASAEEALKLHVVDLISPSESALLNEIDGRIVDVGGTTIALHAAGAIIESRQLGLGASILHWLLQPEFAFIFFYLGIGLIVLEFLHPGIGVGGILGAGSLVAAFVSFGMLPVQLIGIVLLLASAVFFLLELKHPGIGLPTAGGLITLVLGGLFLFNPSVPNARVSLWVLVPVAITTGLFFGFVVSAAVRVRRLPRTTGRQVLVGLEGVVTRELAPRGVVHVASEHWSAESTVGTIPAGTRIRVTDVDGLVLRVEPISERVEGSVS